MIVSEKINEYRRLFSHGVMSGIGWAFGATIGFAILLAILGTLFSWLGHIPVVGDLFSPVAKIVKVTEDPRVEVLRQGGNVNRSNFDVDKVSE